MGPKRCEGIMCFKNGGFLKTRQLHNGGFGHISWGAQLTLH